MKTPLLKPEIKCFLHSMSTKYPQCHKKVHANIIQPEIIYNSSYVFGCNYFNFKIYGFTIIILSKHRLQISRFYGH